MEEVMFKERPALLDTPAFESPEVLLLAKPLTIFMYTTTNF